MKVSKELNRIAFIHIAYYPVSLLLFNFEWPWNLEKQPILFRNRERELRNRKRDLIYDNPRRQGRKELRGQRKSSSQEARRLTDWALGEARVDWPRMGFAHTYEWSQSLKIRLSLSTSKQERGPIETAKRKSLSNKRTDYQRKKIEPCWVSVAAGVLFEIIESDSFSTSLSARAFHSYLSLDVWLTSDFPSPFAFFLSSGLRFIRGVLATIRQLRIPSRQS